MDVPRIPLYNAYGVKMFYGGTTQGGAPLTLGFGVKRLRRKRYRRNEVDRPKGSPSISVVVAPQTKRLCDSYSSTNP